MATRPVKTTNRKPSFFWQGVLILAPVLVLACVGLVAMRKDRALAMREAEVRAGELANELAERLRAELDGPRAPEINAAFPLEARIVLAADGSIITPPPFEPVPTPRPLDAAELSADARALWQRALDADGAAGESISAAARYEEFLATQPPEPFAANASFRRAVLLAGNGDPNASNLFARVAAEFPEAMSEAGLPLAVLARMRVGSKEELFRQALARPSALTPILIEGATNGLPRERWPLVQDARRAWEEQSSLREIAEVAALAMNRAIGTPPRALWVERQNAAPSLLLRTNQTFPVEYRVLSEAEVRRAAETVLASVPKPAWLGFTFSVAGHDVIRANQLREVQLLSGGKGGGQYWATNIPSQALPPLGSANWRDEGATLATVLAWLVGRDLLLEQQEQRTFLFALLIGGAAAVSLLGLLITARAFHRQIRLSEMKSNFVSSVSHELRAPIASVRLMAEGLERGKISEPAKQREYFRFIVQECRRLSSMIENVLDFARIEQGRKEYEFEPTDVRALVEQTVKLMEPYAAERGVKLVTHVSSAEAGRASVSSARRTDTPANTEALELSRPAEDSAPYLTPLIDGPALQQALVNLLDNAIKHSPSGSEVLIELHSHLTPHPSPLTISVSDSGPGIPAHEHDKIFERFYRLGSELRRETPGVGIGLSIVKHIVAAHGGRVRVESEVGRGSKFMIQLPIKTAETRRRGGAE